MGGGGESALSLETRGWIQQAVSNTLWVWELTQNWCVSLAKAVRFFRRPVQWEYSPSFLQQEGAAGVAAWYSASQGLITSSAPCKLPLLPCCWGSSEQCFQGGRSSVRGCWAWSRFVSSRGAPWQPCLSGPGLRSGVSPPSRAAGRGDPHCISNSTRHASQRHSLQKTNSTHVPSLNYLTP